MLHLKLITIWVAHKLVRWFIIGGWAWVSMHCCFIMAHKPRITAGFVTVCCSMKQNSVQPFLQSGKLLAMALGLNFTMKSWTECLACIIMHSPYLKQTQLLCVIWRYCLWAASPCLSWSTFAFSRSICVELDSKRSIVSTFMREL